MKKINFHRITGLIASVTILTCIASLFPMWNAYGATPTINPPADQTILEDGATGDLPFTINDPDSDPLTVSATSSNTGLVPDANIGLNCIDYACTIQITPVGDENGTTTITITVGDGTSTTEGSFLLTVTPVNDPPSFTMGPDVTAFEDVAYSASWAIDVLAGPPNESGQTLTFSVSNDYNSLFSVQPAIASDGALSFTPALDQNGTATVTVNSLQDNGGTANGGVDIYYPDPNTFTITVTSVNDRPSFTMGPDVTVNEDSGDYSAGWAANILAGPPDESWQTLAFSVSNDNNSLFSIQPAIAANGTLTFTPAPDAYGTATVTVNFLRDNGGTSNGGVDTYYPDPNTFTITVNSVNDLPTISSMNDQTIQVNTAITGIAFTVGDVETPPALLVVTASSSNQTLVPDSNLNLSCTGSSCTIDITPTLDQTGITTITISVTDTDNGTTNGSFTLTVNAQPTISDITDRTIIEDGTTSGTFFINDAETPPASLSVQATSSNTTLVPNANITLNCTNQPCTFQVTPAANQNGSAIITIEVRDLDGGTASDTFVLNVTPVNDAPSFTMGSNVTAFEDVAYSAGWATNILAGPPDESGQTLTFSVSNNNSSLFSIQPAIAANGILTFIPTPDANGTAIVTVNFLRDNGGTDNGGVDTYYPAPNNTFTIIVNPVNDAPDFTAADPEAVAEDSGVKVFPNWATFDAGPDDEDAWQTVSAYIITNSNCNSLLSAGPSVSPDGTLSFSTATDQNSTCTFDVRVQDSGGTAFGGINISQNKKFTIVVWEVNDPPVAVDDAIAASLEDVIYRIPFSTLTSNDNKGANNEGFQSLEVKSVSDPVSGTVSIDAPRQEVVFTPLPNYNGPASFMYTVEDNGTTHGAAAPLPSNKAFVSFTINPVNDPPSFSASNPAAVLEDSGAQVVPAWASFDPGPANESSQQVLRYEILSTTCSSIFTAGPTIDNNGTLRYETSPDAYGTCVFSARVLDNGGSTPPDNNASPAKSFTITVDPVNDEPVFIDAGNVTVSEDFGCYTQTLWATSIAAGPANESLQALSWNITVSNPSLFSAKPALDQNGTLTFCTAQDKNGSATVRVSLQDDGGTANGGVNTSSIHIFTITLTAVNDPPVAVDDNYSTAVNEPVSDNVLNNDYDIDNLVTDFYVSQVANPSHGVLILQSNGSFTYTPNLNFAGKDTFTYYISDGGAQSRVATVTITVIPQQDEYLRPWDVQKEYRWVKVRSGIATDLACSATEKGVIITLRSTGDGVVLNCMPENVARLYRVEEDDLPDVPLPNRYKYASGFTLEIVHENELLDVLPSWARISFVIPKESLSYTILYWDPEEEEWFEIPSAIEVNGQGDPFEYDEERMVIIGVRTFKVYNRVEAVINFTGTFILVEK